MEFNNINQFANYVAENIKNYLTSEYADAEIRLDNIMKNNDTNLIALNIKAPDVNISPNIYLEHFYSDYVQGKDLSEILANISDTFQKNAIKADFDINRYTIFDNVKDSITCKLINFENNKAYLADKVFTRKEDLAIVYQVPVLNTPMGRGSITLTKNLLDTYGISEQQLHDIAMENLSKEDFMCRNMSTVLAEMMHMPEDAFPHLPFYVLTNSNMCNGAAGMLCTDYMDKISEQLGGVDLMVLPSSIHECLVAPVEEGQDFEEFKDMVQAVNASEVEPEDKLSDNVYIYDCYLHEIMISDRYVEKTVEVVKTEINLDDKSLLGKLDGFVAAANSNIDTVNKSHERNDVGVLA